MEKGIRRTADIILGPWRLIQPGEFPPPEFLEVIDGKPYVPVREYGQGVQTEKVVFQAPATEVYPVPSKPMDWASNPEF